MPPGNFPGHPETLQATWKLLMPPGNFPRPPENFPDHRGNFQGNLETFPGHLETFNATWKLSRPPENFPDHSGNFQGNLENFSRPPWKLSRPPGDFSDHSGNFLPGKFLSFALLAQACAPWNYHFNANIFVYCVQKVFYDGGSPYGGSTAPKASGSPLYPFQAEEKSEQPLSINVDHLITCDDKTMKMAQTCASNEAHLCWRRSPLGPHITQNWVPIFNKIGSPWYLGAVG